MQLSLKGFKRKDRVRMSSRQENQRTASLHRSMKACRSETNTTTKLKKNDNNADM